MSDYIQALQNGPWMIARHYLVVQRWRLDFDPFNEEFKKLAIWVRVLRLPLEYYNKCFLLKLGNSIGRSLKVDMHMLMEQENHVATDRGKFARLCVEIDLWKQLISKINIRGRIPPI